MKGLQKTCSVKMQGRTIPQSSNCNGTYLEFDALHLQQSVETSPVKDYESIAIQRKRHSGHVL